MNGVWLYSEQPIPDEASIIILRSNTLLSASELFDPDLSFAPIILTDGGWRWAVLSLGAGDAFALTRPSNETIIVNRADFEADRVRKPTKVANERSLSAVIAHERTHTLIRRRFGHLADFTYPLWVREGYCDFVAGSSTLTDQQARELRLTNSQLPALIYYDARQRVASELSANGGSVSDLFERSITTS